MNARPTGSNSDEWHLFLIKHLDNRADNNGLTYMAVQIAEALEEAQERGRQLYILAQQAARKLTK
jgi:hypothetical protein